MSRLQKRRNSLRRLLLEQLDHRHVMSAEALIQSQLQNSTVNQYTSSALNTLQSAQNSAASALTSSSTNTSQYGSYGSTSAPSYNVPASSTPSTTPNAPTSTTTSGVDTTSTYNQATTTSNPYGSSSGYGGTSSGSLLGTSTQASAFNSSPNTSGYSAGTGTTSTSYGSGSTSTSNQPAAQAQGTSTSTSPTPTSANYSSTPQQTSSQATGQLSYWSNQASPTTTNNQNQPAAQAQGSSSQYGSTNYGSSNNYGSNVGSSNPYGTNGQTTAPPSTPTNPDPPLDADNLAPAWLSFDEHGRAIVTLKSGLKISPDLAYSSSSFAALAGIANANVQTIRSIDIDEATLAVTDQRTSSYQSLTGTDFVYIETGSRSIDDDSLTGEVNTIGYTAQVRRTNGVITVMLDLSSDLASETDATIEVYSEAMDFDYGFTFDAAGLLTDSDIEGEYNFSYVFDTGLTTFSDEDADDTPAPQDISAGNPDDEEDDTTSVFDYAGTFQYYFAAEMTIVFSGVNITGSSRVESRVEYTIAGTYSSTFGNTDDDESSPLNTTTEEDEESNLSGSTSGAYSESGQSTIIFQDNFAFVIGTGLVTANYNSSVDEQYTYASTGEGEYTSDELSGELSESLNETSFQSSSTLIVLADDEWTVNGTFESEYAASGTLSESWNGTYEYELDDGGTMIGTTEGTVAVTFAETFGEVAELTLLEEEDVSDNPDEFAPHPALAYIRAANDDEEEPTHAYYWVVTNLATSEASTTNLKSEYAGAAEVERENLSGTATEEGTYSLVTSSNHSITIVNEDKEVDGQRSYAKTVYEKSELDLSGTKIQDELSGEEWLNTSEVSLDSYNDSGDFVWDDVFPTWETDGGTFENRLLYQSDAGYEISGTVEVDDLTGQQTEELRNIINIKSDFVGEFDENMSFTIEEGLSTESIRTVFESDTRLVGEFTEESPVFEFDIEGKQTDHKTQRSTSEYFRSTDITEIGQAPEIEGYYVFEDQESRITSKLATGTYEREEDDLFVEGDYAYELTAESDTNVSINFVLTDDQWTLGFFEETESEDQSDEEPATLTSDFGQTFLFSYEGTGEFLSESDDAIQWSGTSIEDGTIQAISTGHVRSLGSITRMPIAIESPPAEDDETEEDNEEDDAAEEGLLPELQWVSEGAIDEGVSSIHTMEQRAMGSSGRDDLSVVISLTVDASFTNTSFNHREFEDDDWKLTAGNKHELHVIDAQFTARGSESIDDDDLTGSVMFGSFSNTITKKERDDNFDPLSQSWIIVGEKSKTSLTTGGATVQLSGVQMQSAGPASIPVQITINMHSQTRDGESEEHELLKTIEVDSNDTDYEINDADWIKSDASEMQSNSSQMTYTAFGTSAISTGSGNEVMSGNATVDQTIGFKQSESELATYDIALQTWNRKHSKSQDTSIEIHDTSHLTGNYTRSLSGGMLTGTRMQETALIVNIIYKDNSTDHDEAGPSAVDPNALPIAYAELSTRSQQFFAGQPDIDARHTVAFGQSNSGVMMLGIDIQDRDTSSGVGSYTGSYGSTPGNGTINESSNFSMGASFSHDVTKTDGQWANQTSRQILEFENEIEYTDNFSGQANRNHGIYSFNTGLQSWNDRTSNTSRTRVDRSYLNGAWAGTTTTTSVNDYARTESSTLNGTYQTAFGAAIVSGNSSNRVDTSTSSFNTLTITYDSQGNLLFSTGGGMNVSTMSNVWNRSGSGSGDDGNGKLYDYDESLQGNSVTTSRSAMVLASSGTTLVPLSHETIVDDLIQSNIEATVTEQSVTITGGFNEEGVGTRNVVARQSSNTHTLIEIDRVTLYSLQPAIGQNIPAITTHGGASRRLSDSDFELDLVSEETVKFKNPLKNNEISTKITRAETRLNSTDVLDYSNETTLDGVKVPSGQATGSSNGEKKISETKDGTLTYSQDTTLPGGQTPASYQTSFSAAQDYNPYGPSYAQFGTTLVGSPDHASLRGVVTVESDFDGKRPGTMTADEEQASIFAQKLISEYQQGQMLNDLLRNVDAFMSAFEMDRDGDRFMTLPFRPEPGFSLDDYLETLPYRPDQDRAIVQRIEEKKNDPKLGADFFAWVDGLPSSVNDRVRGILGRINGYGHISDIQANIDDDDARLKKIGDVYRFKDSQSGYITFFFPDAWSQEEREAWILAYGVAAINGEDIADSMIGEAANELLLTVPIGSEKIEVYQSGNGVVSAYIRKDLDDGGFQYELLCTFTPSSDTERDLKINQIVALAEIAYGAEVAEDGINTGIDVAIFVAMMVAEGPLDDAAFWLASRGIVKLGKVYHKFIDGRAVVVKAEDLLSDLTKAAPDDAQAQLSLTHLILDQFSCFVAGTPVLTPGGSQSIETLKIGDKVLARPENDPHASLEPYQIEKLHKHESKILELTIRGQVIGTTREHPMYVFDQGWQMAESLSVGDVLLGHDGQTYELEAIKLTDRTESVYNITVGVAHTYFIGGESWGFTIWVHNQYTKFYDEVDGLWKLKDKSGKVVPNVSFADEAAVDARLLDLNAPKASTARLHKFAGLTVEEILKMKKGSIKNADLPEGSPSWNSIMKMTWEQIEAAAKAKQIGFQTIKKLLTDSRFDR
jgi:hypothetical protein